MNLRSVLLSLITLMLVATAALPCQTVTATRAQRAPVTISRCESGLSDDKTGVRDRWMEIGATYKNRTDRAIASIHFRFDFYDRTGRHLGTDYTDDAYGLDPHGESDALSNDVHAEAVAAQAEPSAPPRVYYDPTWQLENTHPSVENVICSVEMVKFADGNTWREQHAITSVEAAHLLRNRRPGDFAWAPDED